MLEKSIPHHFPTANSWFTKWIPLRNEPGHGISGVGFAIAICAPCGPFRGTSASGVTVVCSTVPMAGLRISWRRPMVGSIL